MSSEAELERLRGVVQAVSEALAELQNDHAAKGVNFSRGVAHAASVIAAAVAAAADAPQPAEYQECDDTLDGLIALGSQPQFCARSLGHGGRHSTDRQPSPGSLTWRRWSPADLPQTQKDDQR